MGSNPTATARGVRDIVSRTHFGLFEAIVFNILIGGTDAHAMNYSLLFRGPRVALAPLAVKAAADGAPTPFLKEARRVADAVARQGQLRAPRLRGSPHRRGS